MRYADAKCTYTEQFQPEHVYVFTGPCVVTGAPVTVVVPAAGLHAYRAGALMQDAFPAMSADDREFLMSGMSPMGWAATFLDDE